MTASAVSFFIALRSYLPILGSFPRSASTCPYVQENALKSRLKRGLLFAAPSQRYLFPILIVSMIICNASFRVNPSTHSLSNSLWHFFAKSSTSASYIFAAALRCRHSNSASDISSDMRYHLSIIYPIFSRGHTQGNNDDTKDNTGAESRDMS